MLPIGSTTVRLFLHVLAATVWVGGQLTLGTVIPALRPAGPETIRAWLVGRGAGCNGSRLVPTQASGAPSFAQYRPAPDGGHVPWALIVLELDGDRITAWNSFLDTEKLFPLFGLPLRLPPGDREAVATAAAQGA